MLLRLPWERVSRAVTLMAGHPAVVHSNTVPDTRPDMAEPVQSSVSSAGFIGLAYSAARLRLHRAALGPVPGFLSVSEPLLGAFLLGTVGGKK